MFGRNSLEYDFSKEYFYQEPRMKKKQINSNNVFSVIKKLTILDYIFAAFFVFLVLFILSFFRRSDKDITIRFRVTSPESLYETDIYGPKSPTNDYAYAFQVGDAETNELGQIINQITAVDRYPISPTRQIIYLDMKVKTSYNAHNQQYTFKGKPVVFGQSYSFVLKNVKFDAIVVDFPGFEENLHVENKKVTVKAQLLYASRQFSEVYGVLPYLAEAVKKGDQMKTSQGNILVEVKDVSITPAKRTTISNTGQPIVISDPLLKDVTYTLEINAKKIGDKLYLFEDLPIELDQGVPLHLEKVSVYPTIIEVDQ
jgi:hypothetical protein